MATLRDLARRSGLSISTVSRALSGHPHVGEETRRRVAALARELSYHPNVVARSLRRMRTQTAGLIIPDILNDFYATSATVLQSALEHHGYRLILCIGNDDPAGDRNYLRALVEQRVDGVIHVPCTPAGARVLREMGSAVPVVELLRHTSSRLFDAVVADDREGALQLTRHLIGLGHRRIAMITGPGGFSTTRARVAGFREAFRETGLPGTHAEVAHGYYTRAFGYDATRRVMAGPDRPTALFSSGSPLTVGVLRALGELRAAVPDDLSLVCFEDPDWYAASMPPLTCYALPLREMGLVAAQLLVSRMETGDGEVAMQPTISRFSGRLVVRASTAPLRAAHATERRRLDARRRPGV